MIPIIIDIVLVAILAVFIYFGVQKGFILGVGGILALVVAIYVAGIVANTYSSWFTPMIEPIVSKYVDNSVTAAKNELTGAVDNTVAKIPVGNLGLESLQRLGLFSDTAQKLVDELKYNEKSIGQEFISLVTKKVSTSIAYILTFIATCLIITILLNILIRILDAAFMLPGLGFVNDTGGFLLGFAKGMLILFVVAWAMRYFGGVFPYETTEKTILLKWLMGNNLLAAFFGI